MQIVCKKHAAVFRTESTLAKGCELMKEIHSSFNELKITDRGLIWNSDLIEALELDNLRSASFGYNFLRLKS